MELTPQLTGAQSAGNEHVAGGEMPRGFMGQVQTETIPPQQSSNMTDPKPPRWRKWGRKECLMRCVVTTEEGASPPRPQPTTQRAPSSHSALTGGRAGGGPWVSWTTQPQSCKMQTAICWSAEFRALEKHRMKGMPAGKKTGSVLQDPLHQPGGVINP